MEYFPIFVLLMFGIIVAGAIIVLDLLLGPRRPNAVKNAVYECGNPDERILGNARDRYHVRYYLTGLLFLVFDLAAVILYPVAVAYRVDRVTAGILVFACLGILTIGYAWTWRKGALEWE